MKNGTVTSSASHEAGDGVKYTNSALKHGECVELGYESLSLFVFL